MKKLIFPLLMMLAISTSLFAQKNKETIVKLDTDYGTIKLKLYNETPIHRDNFIKLVEEGFYNGTLFHRVIKQFMLQGGDPDSKNATAGQRLGNGGPGYTLEAEIKPQFIHKKGALAAARLSDQANPERRSSGSQFYIVQGRKYQASDLQSMEMRKESAEKQALSRAFFSKPENKNYADDLTRLRSAGDKEGLTALKNEVKKVIDAVYEKNPVEKYTEEQISAYSTIGGTPHLDKSYTVFGEVIEGLDVIDKIAAAETQPGDRPVKDIKMTLTIVK